MTEPEEPPTQECTVENVKRDVREAKEDKQP